MGLLSRVARGLLIVVASLVAGCGLQARAPVAVARELGRCGMRALERVAQRLCCVGLVALGHVGSSQARDPTHVCCAGRQTPNRWAPGESCTCALDVFVGRGELRVLLLWHLDSDV